MEEESIKDPKSMFELGVSIYFIPLRGCKLSK